MTIQKSIPVFLLIFFLLLMSPIIEEPTSAVGDKWFVSENGAGTDCSRTNPGPLQYCVEQKAQSGDTVYVGEGFYVADNPTDDNLLLIEKSIHLIGSCTWDAAGPITCEPQNVVPAVTPSRLNGENQRRVIAVQGSGSNVTIENFVIYQGNADGKTPKPAGVVGAGGGIYAADIDTLIVKNNYIWSNRASISGGSCDSGSGGGVFASVIPSLTIEENIIQFNSSSAMDVNGYGGGLFIQVCGDGGEVNILSNDIHGNRGGSTSTLSKGGGAFLRNVWNLQLDDNMFEYQNTIPPGDCWNEGSAVYLEGVSADSVDGNLFKDNFGESIVFIKNVTFDFTCNKFWNNESFYDLKILWGNVINLVNNFFGKMYGYSTTSQELISNSRGGISTLVYVSAANGAPQVNILHNTFAFAEYGVQMEGKVEVDIYRNIFTSHSDTAIDVLEPVNVNVSVNENLFWANTMNGKTGSKYWEADPLLVDPFNGDFHLQPGSAAIDKVSGGSITTDIDGEPRPMGFGVDMGADEFEDDIYLFLPLILY